MARINPGGMFVPSWLMGRRDLSSEAKLVYVKFAYSDGKCSVETLAASLGMSHSVVKRAIKKLVAHKLLEAL